MLVFQALKIMKIYSLVHFYIIIFTITESLLIHFLVWHLEFLCIFRWIRISKRSGSAGLNVMDTKPPLYFMIEQIFARDRAERHDFLSRIFLFILLYFFTFFLGGNRKGEKNHQSRCQNSCLSAKSF